MISFVPIFQRNQSRFPPKKNIKESLVTRITIILFLFLSDLAEQQKLRNSTLRGFWISEHFTEELLFRCFDEVAGDRNGGLWKGLRPEVGGKAVKGEFFLVFVQKNTHYGRKQNQRC